MRKAIKTIAKVTVFVLLPLVGLGVLGGIIEAYNPTPGKLIRPAAAVIALPAPEPAEGEPGWDCRLHGNRSCYPAITAITEDGFVVLANGTAYCIADAVCDEN